jgi:peptide/nickel transport system substrate-binding protein
MKFHWKVFTLLAVLLIPSLAVVGQDCQYNESPMLAEMVAAGTLPSVCERLPENPVVIETGTLMPADLLQVEIGNYSDELRVANAWSLDVPLREPLWLTSNLGSTPQSYVIDSFTANEDNTVFTFVLRDGMKWSDGVPVTTADVAFAIEDVLFNEELYPNMPTMFLTGARRDGTPLQFRVIDDLTFEVSFDQPYGGFIDQLMQNEFQGYHELIKPRHYLEQFHVDYAEEDELAQLMEEGGFENWFQLFSDKDLRNWQSRQPNKLGHPVLSAWMLESVEGGRTVVVRNPYYIAVDAAGNQLPYFDRIVAIDVPEGQTGMVMGMGGEVDIASGNFTDIPLLLENQRDVYTVYRYNDNGGRAFFLNLTKEDPAWQELVSDIRFRQAVNMAIDREEILDNAYAGTGFVSEVVPSDFDPDAANALLDEIGLTERDADGFRLGLDGQPLTIEVDLGPWQEYFDPVPLIAAHLGEIGLRVDYRQVAPELLWETMAANTVEGRYDWDRSNTWRFRHNHNYLPSDNWAPLWADWYQTNGTTGQEPPDWIKELYDIHAEIMEVVPGTPEDAAAMDRLYAWFNENIPYFTIVEGPVYPIMVNNRIGNVMTGGFGHAFSRTWKLLYDKTAAGA